MSVVPPTVHYENIGGPARRARTLAFAYGGKDIAAAMFEQWVGDSQERFDALLLVGEDAFDRYTPWARSYEVSAYAEDANKEHTAKTKLEAGLQAMIRFVRGLS